MRQCSVIGPNDQSQVVSFFKVIMSIRTPSYVALLILISQTASQSLRTGFRINSGGSKDGDYSSDAWNERPKWFELGGQSETLSPKNVWMLRDKKIVIDYVDPPPKTVLQSLRFGYMDTYDNPGPFKYEVTNLKNGLYKCSLYFVEHNNIDTVSREGQRVFTFDINGVGSGSIDIFKEKGIDAALQRTLKGIVVKDNNMTIKFNPKVNKACVSAVVCNIQPAKEVTLMKELKINAGGDEIGDYKSDIWNKRPHWIKLLGQSEFANPTNTWELREKNFPVDECVAPDSTVFQSYRFGYTKSYGIPGPIIYEVSKMANGVYSCKLYFVETVVTKPRKRRFTAKVQSMETSTIDIFGEKGRNAVLVRSMHSVNVTKNLLKIEIMPEVNNPVLSALYCKFAYPNQ